MRVLGEARASVPATCGELLQGVDAEGPVLVSLPVDLWGTVQVQLTDDEGVVSVTPCLPHARAALGLALDRAAWRGGATVRLGSEIPHARGMGSSTADVAGVIAGVAAAAGVELSPQELVALMTRVEPSDSSPLCGLWAIDHVGGRRAQRLATMPAEWWLAVVDSGVPVRTVDVHAGCGPGPSLPAGVLRGTDWQDPVALARVASESAMRSQERLPHPAFNTMRSVGRRLGALGLCSAHSGSLCGLICAGSAAAVEARAALTAGGLRAELYRACAPGLRVAAPAVPGRGGQTRPLLAS